MPIQSTGFFVGLRVGRLVGSGPVGSEEEGENVGQSVCDGLNGEGFFVGTLLGLALGAREGVAVLGEIEGGVGVGPGV